MITLSILAVLYTFFGFRRFKKRYGDYNIFGEEPKVWTIALALLSFYVFIISILFIITFLP